ncbi:MAG TPA: hypothetical protein QF753_07985 [Victivallales bacterium]|nr:hypothetical protein [Victivallales bacterium]
MQWHHFAYMIISIALLGWGAAGTFLTLFRRKLLAAKTSLLPVLCLLCCLVIIINNYIFQQTGIIFDSYLLFTGFMNFGRFILTIIMFTVPFFLGALFIGINFINYSQRIGKVYCANLIGSGLGCIFFLLIAWSLPPLQISAVLSIITAITAIFVSCNKKTIITISIFFVIASTMIASFFTGQPSLSEYKDLSRTMNIPDAKIIVSNNSPYGMAQVVSSNSLRNSLSISFRYSDILLPCKRLFINGNLAGDIVQFDDNRNLQIYNFTSKALPYLIRKNKNILIINSGTGSDIAVALKNGTGAIAIDGVESNPFINNLLKKQLGNNYIEQGGHVSLYTENFRSFLNRSDKKYDLIALPNTNSFGENTGLNAIQPYYYITYEAVNFIWHNLTSNGMIAINCWQEYPPRQSFKILSTLVKVLRNNGINNPSRHLVAVKSWGDITFVLSKSIFSKKEIKKVKDFSSYLYFDPIILPVGIQNNDSQNNKRADNEIFLKGLQKILISDKKFIDSYPLNIKPVTDNKPYFSQFLKIKFLPEFIKLYRENNITFMDTGYLILLLTFAILSMLAVLLIILPLFFISLKKVNNKFMTFLYFSGIGIGYMFVEIVLIHSFSLYFSSIIYSTALIISIMLICSGIGSLSTDRTNYKIVRKLIYLIIILIVYGFFLNNVLNYTMGYQFIIKLLISIILVGILAYIMGIPFPVAIKDLSNKSVESASWGWCINSCFSVLSPSLAILLSVVLGFSAVMYLSALLYLIPMLYFLYQYKYR